jgi:sugar O-acyltransferase (sialic acid O-acetyltransferase NeuD family)
MLGTVDALHIGGTGSFAAEVAGWVTEAGVEVIALIELRAFERVGTVTHGLRVLAISAVPADGRAVLGIGGDRRKEWARLAAAGWAAATVIHPTANVATGASVDEGVTIGPLTAVGTATTLAAHALLSRGVLVGHHTHIGAYATLNPGVNVGGNTVVGDGAFLGMGAVVANGLHIGADAIVAAGAVVLRDVPAGARVQGVPARPHAP